MCRQPRGADGSRKVRGNKAAFMNRHFDRPLMRSREKRQFCLAFIVRPTPSSVSPLQRAITASAIEGFDAMIRRICPAAGRLPTTS
jgi:hypothetical protein